jgi:hypothetical protein
MLRFRRGGVFLDWHRAVQGQHHADVSVQKSTFLLRFIASAASQLTAPGPDSPTGKA